MASLSVGLLRSRIFRTSWFPAVFSDLSRPRIHTAGSKLIWKFREHFSFADTECAGGRIIRRAQCDHRPHKAPVGLAEIRGVADQCRQRILKRL